MGLTKCCYMCIELRKRANFYNRYHYSWSSCGDKHRHSTHAKLVHATHAFIRWWWKPSPPVHFVEKYSLVQ